MGKTHHGVYLAPRFFGTYAALVYAETTDPFDSCQWSPVVDKYSLGNLFASCRKAQPQQTPPNSLTTGCPVYTHGIKNAEADV